MCTYLCFMGNTKIKPLKANNEKFECFFCSSFTCTFLGWEKIQTFTTSWYLEKYDYRVFGVISK